MINNDRNDELEQAVPSSAAAVPQHLAVPDGWKLVPVEPTPEIIAGAAIASWPTASLADIDLARQAAPLVLMQMDMAPGTTVDALAGMLATMAPAYRAMLAAAPVQAQHSDDAAIDRFAAAMKAKMAASRAKGRSGWDDPTQCSVDNLAAMLCQHVEKGDPVDIANFAMMIHERQGSAIDVYEALAVFLNSRSIIAPVQPVAVPDGWKLVPLDPTTGMINALYHDGYTEMLDAAPAAPAAQGNVETARQAAFKEAIEACYKTVADRAKVRHIGDAAHYSACADAIRTIAAKAAS